MSLPSPLTFDILIAQLWQQLPGKACDWLKTAIQKLTDNDDAPEYQLLCSAMARRKLGNDQLNDLPGTCIWHADEAGRLLLLSTLLKLSPSEVTEQLVKAAFKQGDEHEQIAIIKGLALIDNEGKITDLAIATGRTNSTNLFSAIALNNPYPALHYQDEAFNQLVLKTLFMDLDVSQIIGLKQHLSPTLSLLCVDLVKERVAANRQPPPSIWLAIDNTHLNETDQALAAHQSTSSAPMAE